MILIAPDSFKGSLSAQQAACGIADRLQQMPECAAMSVQCCPLADGGEGTASVLATHFDSAWRTVKVMDPLGRMIEARWLWIASQRLAVVEVAEAIALHHLDPAERNPMHTTSFGVGQLIRDALAMRPEKIIVTLGGSSTTDAGLGMWQALGVGIFDHDDQLMTEPIRGGDLLRVGRIAFDQVGELLGELLGGVCDVRNVLLGSEGAARVYAEQKGANADEVHQLEQGVRHVVQLLESAYPQLRGLADQPGAGAAGGLGYALAAGMGASLCEGAGWLLDRIDFNAKLRHATTVITGEGQLDDQTRYGKLIAQVARRAADHGVPCWAIAGHVTSGLKFDAELPLIGSIALTQLTDVKHALAEPQYWLGQAAERLMREQIIPHLDR